MLNNTYHATIKASPSQLMLGLCSDHQRSRRFHVIANS